VADVARMETISKTSLSLCGLDIWGAAMTGASINCMRARHGKSGKRELGWIA